MLNISIDNDKAIIDNPDYHANNVCCPLRWTLDTDKFFGDVYATLEKHFPDFDCSQMGSRIVSHVLGGLSGRGSGEQVKIFGCNEIGTSLYDLIMFIDSREVISPTLKDIEDMRIFYKMTTNYLPTSLENNGGMCFEGLRTVTQIMVAALYFYAYNEYKLVRCSHCGKWFATKTLKVKYCKRTSPCFGIIVKGKEPLHCEEAVRNIMQNCGRIKNRVETKAATARRGNNSYLYKFSVDCDKFYLDAKNAPTVEK